MFWICEGVLGVIVGYFEEKSTSVCVECTHTRNSDKNVENELKKHKLSRIIAAYLILFANFT